MALLSPFSNLRLSVGAVVVIVLICVGRYDANELDEVGQNADTGEKMDFKRVYNGVKASVFVYLSKKMVSPQ